MPNMSYSLTLHNWFLQDYLAQKTVVNKLLVEKVIAHYEYRYMSANSMIEGLRAK